MIKCSVLAVLSLLRDLVCDFFLRIKFQRNVSCQFSFLCQMAKVKNTVACV